MRTYLWSAYRPGGFMFFPDRCCESKAKIRVVASLLFRKWFGHAPSGGWHKNGFMSEVWDRRGNKIQVSQINGREPGNLSESFD